MCNYGVVPVENSTEGMVTHTLDSFATSSLNICGEVLLRIGQNLMTHATLLADIRRVYSHSQSLAQCRSWLAENLPHADIIMVGSNGEAARLASEDTEAAAIAGKMAAELYGVPVRYPHIEDDGNNTTRFLVIGQQASGISGCDKTTILVSSQNRPGLLYQLLEPIGRHGINMTRIESRPSRRGMWEYVFFIDLEGHRDEPQMRVLLDEIRDRASLFRILGSYPQSVLQ